MLSLVALLGADGSMVVMDEYLNSVESPGGIDIYMMDGNIEDGTSTRSMRSQG